jgi:hypothetical protein
LKLLQLFTNHFEHAVASLLIYLIEDLTAKRPLEVPWDLLNGN